MTTVQVGRWTYVFRAPEGLVMEVLVADEGRPQEATVIHWPSRDCRAEGEHGVRHCLLYDYITTPVNVQRVA